MRMKLIMVMIIATVLAGIAVAEVPGQINYQGYLTDTDRNPVNGNVTVAIGIYTNPAGGSAVYTENIGTVAVTDGIYSFHWGASGTSVVTVTEQIGITDGSATVYNYTTTKMPILNPSVTIYDGTYSWNDVTGSSSPANFLGSVSSYPNGTISAIYLSGAPAAGRTINVQYSYRETGSSRAILDASAAWLQVTLNGEALSPRQSLVSVPYSISAKYADIANQVVSTTSTFSRICIETTANNGVKYYIPWAPLANDGNINAIVSTAPLCLPDGAILTRLNASLYDNQNYVTGSASVGLNRVDANGNGTLLGGFSTGGTWAGGATNCVAELSEHIDNGHYFYYISFNGYRMNMFGTTVQINKVTVDYQIEN